VPTRAQTATKRRHDGGKERRWLELDAKAKGSVRELGREGELVR
jgi:hypothetical protein